MADRIAANFINKWSAWLLPSFFISFNLTRPILLLLLFLPNNFQSILFKGILHCGSRPPFLPQSFTLFPPPPPSFSLEDMGCSALADEKEEQGSHNSIGCGALCAAATVGSLRTHSTEEKEDR